MANAVVTNVARNNMRLARSTGKNIKIVGFVFGNGGVNSDGSVKEASEEQTSLNSELLRKEYDTSFQIGNMTTRYECTLSVNELVGESISEIGLYDINGDLVAIKNFKPKLKDSDIEMTFRMDDIF